MYGFCASACRLLQLDDIAVAIPAFDDRRPGVGHGLVAIGTSNGQSRRRCAFREAGKSIASPLGKEIRPMRIEELRRRRRFVAVIRLDIFISCFMKELQLGDVTVKI